MKLRGWLLLAHWSETQDFDEAAPHPDHLHHLLMSSAECKTRWSWAEKLDKDDLLMVWEIILLLDALDALALSVYLSEAESSCQCCRGTRSRLVCNSLHRCRRFTSPFDRRRKIIRLWIELWIWLWIDSLQIVDQTRRVFWVSTFFFDAAKLRQSTALQKCHVFWRFGPTKQTKIEKHGEKKQSMRHTECIISYLYRYLTIYWVLAPCPLRSGDFCDLFHSL